MSIADEAWKPVVGYESFYEVSTRGRVKSLDREIEGHTPGGLRCRWLRRGRVLRHIPDSDKYHGVRLSVDGKAKRRLVHHLVLEAFVGRRPDGLEGCHDNDDKDDNTLENLRWDTSSENKRDWLRNGRVATHCKRRHPLSGDNLYVVLDKVTGWPRRGCRTCRRMAMREFHARRKASV